jgi:hypothetical protein
MQASLLLVTYDQPTREFGRMVGGGDAAWLHPVFWVALNERRIYFDTTSAGLHSSSTRATTTSASQVHCWRAPCGSMSRMARRRIPVQDVDQDDWRSRRRAQVTNHRVFGLPERSLVRSRDLRVPPTSYGATATPALQTASHIAAGSIEPHGPTLRSHSPNDAPCCKLQCLPDNLETQ